MGIGPDVELKHSELDNILFDKVYFKLELQN